MKDFTLKKYGELLRSLLASGYEIRTFRAALESEVPERCVILRHDVDLRAENSLATAMLESDFGVSASYYFRLIKQSDKPQIVRAIAASGHEIGYHYEDMTICRGDIDAAYEHFKAGLEHFRQYYPVCTICMHGSPRSAYDGRDLWKKYDYRKLGIIGEPYFDVDFEKFFYLTDTGRRWDGHKVSVRDKIPGRSEAWEAAGLTFHSTDDVIAAINSGKLPPKVMIVTHPQRWNDDSALWWRELISQSAKNVVKRIIVKRG